MITLEQIKLLEGRISRAIELIHSLKEENATLRKGLESAQRRMKELEVMVDGFKSDQKEIESVIVRTLHNLDELEENATAKHPERGVGAAPAAPAVAPAERGVGAAPAAPAVAPVERGVGAAPAAAPAAQAAATPGTRNVEPGAHAAPDAVPRPTKEELDIF